MIFLLLASTLALADPATDLRVAADAEAPEVARMEAFDRLVTEGATDLGLVVQTSLDDDADARARWVCTRVLGKVGGDRARDTLLALLDNDMPAMRTAAVQALGDLGDPANAPAVAAKLTDPAILVRAGAAEALGKLRDPDTVPALDAALSAKDAYYRGSSLWVRRHYVEALGQIGSERAIPTLLRALDDGDPAVVGETLRAFEAVARFSYADGRDEARQREAWRRWAQSKLQ